MTQDLREALEEKVQEWRDEAQLRRSHSGMQPWDYEADGIKECVRDIEELLQEHQE